MSERAVPFHCPYCGDEDLLAARGRASGDVPRRLGVPGLPARLLAEDARPDPTAREAPS